MKKSKEKGITLVALVVTIVVLIILATVSISAIFDDNGIIKQAQKAKSTTANSTVMEEKEMEQMLQEYNNSMAEPTYPAAGTEVEKPSNWTSIEVTPIANESDLTRTDFDSDGQPTTGLDTGFIEPCSTGYSTEASEYNTMKTQVIKYGGFYIGRYEAGINSTTLITVATTAQTVVSKKRSSTI